MMGPGGTAARTGYSMMMMMMMLRASVITRR